MSQAQRAVLIHESDLPSPVFHALVRSPALAWDIETTGLDWERERIETCQVADLEGDVHLVRIRSGLPSNLVRLLAATDALKIFHYALFDLRFMAHWWGARPASIACTKIASKILEPQETDHSLKTLAAKHLGVVLDKGQRLSNWSAEHLSTAQVEYACGDVIHLAALLEVLRRKADDARLSGLLDACFAHIPTRVQLELRHYPDVYTY